MHDDFKRGVNRLTPETIKYINEAFYGVAVELGLEDDSKQPVDASRWRRLAEAVVDGEQARRLKMTPRAPATSRKRGLASPLQGHRGLAMNDASGRAKLASPPTV
jgi:hypothetical protein